jgi:response regulator NasT
MRQIIIAFTDQDVARKIKYVLASNGLPVAGICVSAAQVLQQASMLEGGGVVVCPYRLADMTARELMSLLPDDYDMLVLVTPRQQVQINEPGIYSLSQPVNGPVLIDSARQLLETRQLRLDRVLQSLRPAPAAARPAETRQPGDDPVHNRPLDEKKVIEQAKYLLMNRHHLNEEEAHRYLQKKSMESGMRLADLARRVIQSG